MAKTNKTLIEAAVLGAPATVLALRGIDAFTTQDSWDAPKYGRPIHYLGHAAQLQGIGYLSLAIMLVGAWICFSLKKTSIGAALMVSSFIASALSFATLLTT
ncbi:hypothetical protein [Sphingomonas sp. SKA58]|jgi:hypothetical protein|uniref:hypothetical protein n=1 Tax=Sphingomonas sp. (strain SKA58) TaxID=314266 RepID=UPI00055EEDF8|nr:hypothetical protein [Sphingomonas sp. SKA58]